MCICPLDRISEYLSSKLECCFSSRPPLCLPGKEPDHGALTFEEFIGGLISLAEETGKAEAYASVLNASQLREVLNKHPFAEAGKLHVHAHLARCIKYAIDVWLCFHHAVCCCGFS